METGVRVAQAAAAVREQGPSSASKRTGTKPRR